MDRLGLRKWMKTRPRYQRMRRQLESIEERFFAVIYDLTRITNDGSYQAMDDATIHNRAAHKNPTHNEE